MLFPIVALLGASGIIVGILNSYDEFSIPALAPVAWNLAIILGLVLGVPQAHTADGKLYVYAGSIVVGTVIQVLLPGAVAARLAAGGCEMVIDWRDPAVRQVLKLMLPVALGLGLINFNALVDGVFAANRIDADLGAGRDRRGVPHLHAPAGHLLGRGRDGALPVARALRRRAAT